MSSRCVVNVGSGRYRQGSERLREAIKEFGHCEFMSWTDPLPEKWPRHEDKPYAFKAYALKVASHVHDVLLWCDSAVLPIARLDPLWERIERQGYWVPLNGWTTYQWTADSAYADLFPERSIEEAREVNKTVPHCCATAFGVNVRSPIGDALLTEYFRLANTNAFCGPWSNTNNPNHWPQDASRMGPCGPPDVLGHRHDQSSLSVIAWRLGIKLSQCPWGFAYPPPSEETVLLAVGA